MDSHNVSYSKKFMKKSVFIRFYEELNEFLDEQKRKKEFKASLTDVFSVEDLIRSLGVPPEEVDLILVNGRSVSFAFTPQDGDRISVYPVFETFDISTVTRLKDRPLRDPKFILDTDLYELAKMLRFSGFDALYGSDRKKEEIINLSLTENRTILTRNRELLLSREVVRGYLVKHKNPARQFDEVINHFDLKFNRQ